MSHSFPFECVECGERRKLAARGVRTPHACQSCDAVTTHEEIGDVGVDM